MTDSVNADSANSKITLDPTEQAAIILLSMGEEIAAGVLRCLSRDELLGVTQSMSQMTGIKVDVVKVAIQGFFDAWREQSGVQGASRAFLKRSLNIAFGSEVANSVLNSLYGDAIRPKMARLQWAQPQWLAERLSREHIRIQAVFLAFLPPEHASLVIDVLPSESRDLVLLHIARLKEIDQSLLRELETVADLFLEGLGMRSASIEGAQQAAEIISHLPLPSDRERMVELLRARDPEVVFEVENSLYDFSILSRQPEAVITRLMDLIPMEEWGIALKHADPALIEAIKQSMPRRQVQIFEEMLRSIGPVSVNRVNQARQNIMGQARELAEAGEIELRFVAEEMVA